MTLSESLKANEHDLPPAVVAGIVKLEADLAEAQMHAEFERRVKGRLETEVVELKGERDALTARVLQLEQELENSRRDERCAMSYLNQAREIVDANDFPEMLNLLRQAMGNMPRF